MKKISTTAAAVALLVAGFGAAFQVGRTAGFKTGSEWALVQADILARESGLFMPVYLDGDNFKIVLRQPQGLYKRAWELADRYEETKGPLRTAKLGAVDRQEAPNSDI